MARASGRQVPKGNADAAKPPPAKAVGVLRRPLVRLALAALCIGTLLAAPVLMAHDPGEVRPASVGSAGGVPAAPLLALAILGAMSGLVLLVAFRPAR